MRGRVRSCCPSARRPPRAPPRGSRVRPGTRRAVRESPHPRGSRFGDVTWARIAPGGLARIERRRIMSRWARTARGEVDCVALSSHCASRVRVLPGWSAPPRARRGPARASARGRREPGPGPCPIPSCLRPGPQDHRPSPRGCSLGGPARRRGRGARRCPDSRRDPARGLSHRHPRVGVHPAPARKTDANKIASAGTRIRTATATRLGRAPAARTTTNPRPGASARTAWTTAPGSGDVQSDRASAGAGEGSF